VIAKIAEVLGSVGTNPDPQTTMFRMRDNVQTGRRRAEQAARDLEAILTPEQWAKLPANVERMPSCRRAAPKTNAGESASRCTRRLTDATLAVLCLP
jgi:hypothetical protein